MSVGLSVRMELLGSKCTNVYKIWYLKMFEYLIENIRSALKSDQDNGYFTLKPANIYFTLKPANIYFTRKPANIYFTRKPANIYFTLKPANIYFT